MRRLVYNITAAAMCRGENVFLSDGRAVVTAEHDRSSFVDASLEHNDLYSAIRKFIRPDAFSVHHEGHHKDHKAATVPAEPAAKTTARKKSGTAKAKAKPTPKPTPAPKKAAKPAAVEEDDEEYEYEDDEE